MKASRFIIPDFLDKHNLDFKMLREHVKSCSAYQKSCQWRIYKKCIFLNVFQRGLFYFYSDIYTYGGHIRKVI